MKTPSQNHQFKIRDAVSVVLTCGEDVFVVQRQPFLSAFPGYWAFPGGKVESNDDEVINHEKSEHFDGFDRKLLGTMVREILEELNLDLRKEIQAQRVVNISLLGQATTPDFNPHRFATYFFKVELRQKPHIVVDENEARIADWMPAHELYQLYQQGHLLAVPPVIKLMKQLGRNPFLTKVENIEFTYDAQKHVPMIESLVDVKQFMPLSHTLPPAQRTNAFLISDDVLVDPSPRDQKEYQKLLNSLKPFSVNKVFLTHHHPDHCERANDLARELKVPLLLSQVTHQFMIERDADYFHDIEVLFVKENDIVTTWLGSPVKVMEIPGHDEGQLALYPENLNWFIAGDLFQGIGTVVIGGKEGNMTKYFHSLNRVIELSPRVLFPSHGIGLGGVHFLEKTLQHRRNREEEVLKYALENYSAQEMLPLIYKGLNEKLLPYALMNIEKHLEKLKNENKI